MSRVDVFKCDQCGKQGADMVRVSVERSGVRGNMYDGFTQGHLNVPTRVSVAGGKRPQMFTEVDLCSPECAGRFFFGEPQP